jgi:hypothetical protein
VEGKAGGFLLPGVAHRDDRTGQGDEIAGRILGRRLVGEGTGAPGERRGPDAGLAGLAGQAWAARNSAIAAHRLLPATTSCLHRISGAP